MNLYICSKEVNEHDSISLTHKEAGTVFAKYIIKSAHFDLTFIELTDSLPYGLLSMVRTASDRIFIRSPAYINEKMVYLLGEIYPDKLGQFLTVYRKGGDVYALLCEVW